VTDDKSLPKEHRKELQAETAHKKSPKAKVIKLADKISNLRALATSPAPDWSVRRNLEYISWARKVVAGLRGTNEILEKQFDAAAQAAELSLVRAHSRDDSGTSIFWTEHQPAHATAGVFEEGRLQELRAELGKRVAAGA
jgi:hypothetical protein